MSERFLLLGHPVGHSLSPAIHAAAYAELQRPAQYDLVDAPDESAVQAQVERLRRGEIRGANVTVPWKRVALALADRVEVSARDVGAANVLARAEDGQVVAHNTDAPGLAGELDELLGDLEAWNGGGTACVIGNGGAALGAVVACRLAGAQRIFVVARRFRGDRGQWPRREEFETLGAQAVAWPTDPDAKGEEWAAVLREVLLFVQATSAGMRGSDPGDEVAALVPWRDLSRKVAAYDLVYNPAETPFLQQAAAGGHLLAGGLGMLVRQAALAIEIWWGTRPPLEPLRAAAEQCLLGAVPGGAEGRPQ